MEGLKVKKEHKELAILLSLAVFLFIIGWTLGIAPVNDEIRKYQLKSVEAQAKMKLTSEIQKLQKQENEYGEFLFEYEQRLNALAKVTALANESGLEVLSMEPSEAPEEFFTKYILNLNVRTNFVSLFKFLKKLEAMKPPFVVRELDLGEMSKRSHNNRLPNQGGRISASLRLEGLMKKEV